MNTDRPPDDMFAIVVAHRPFGWADRLRILFGCGLSQSLPVAVWIEDGRTAAKVKSDGSLAVNQFFGAPPAIAAQGQATP